MQAVLSCTAGSIGTSADAAYAQLSDVGILRRCGTGNHFVLSMDIDLIFKIAAIGIIVSILNQVLARSGREEQATMTTIAGLVVVLMLLIDEIGQLFETVRETFGI